MSSKSEHVRQAIDAVAADACQQITTCRRWDSVRTAVAVSLPLILIAPLLAVVTQVIRWQAGLAAGQWFSWPALVALSLAVPVAWLIFRVMNSTPRVDRLRSLGAMDAALGASERLVTADQFLKSARRDAFMQAAVEDSVDWAARGRLTRLDTAANAIRPGWALATIPLALLIMLLAAWIAGLAIAVDGPGQLPSSQPTPAALATAPETRSDQSRSEPDPQVAPAPRTQRSAQPARSAKQRATIANVTPDGAEESAGRLTDGETSQSQQTSNPSSARGQPATQAQSSKSGVQTPRKPKTDRKPPKPSERPQRRPDEKQDPSGATAGQGSSRGSQNNAAANDWASRSQQATPDDEDVENEDDVDDEEEEQTSRGGVQPNMRDRRTPVNRDLQIGFGSSRPNPDANGRGGPGGQKKSRGVASLVLGVPIPDRINGQPNKGRIRVTQQRVTPEAEESDRVIAQPRAARTGLVGPIHHPQLAPWLQDFVRRYFLTRRKSAEPRPAVPPRNPTTQRSQPAESNDRPS